MVTGQETNNSRVIFTINCNFFFTVRSLSFYVYFNQWDVLLYLFIYLLDFMSWATLSYRCKNNRRLVVVELIVSVILVLNLLATYVNCPLQIMWCSRGNFCFVYLELFIHFRHDLFHFERNNSQGHHHVVYNGTTNKRSQRGLSSAQSVLSTIPVAIQITL